MGRTIFSQRAQTVPCAAASVRALSPCQGVAPSGSPEEEEEEEEEKKEEEAGWERRRAPPGPRLVPLMCWLPTCWRPRATLAWGLGF